MLYEYLFNKNIDLEIIHTQINMSNMYNKSIKWCRWDEDIQKLKIMFLFPLSNFDESILDDIIKLL